MKKITFRPISAKIILKTIEKEELTEGGIVIPDNVRDSYNKGEALTAEVLAVGPGLDEHRHLPGGGMDCQVGDLVLIHSNEGLNFKLEGQSFLSLYEKFVMAKITKE